MKSNPCYTLYSPQVIQELIDGEVIIVNLEKGAYYSLRDSGADIWNLALAGLPESEIISAMKARYDGNATEIEAGVAKLLQDLAAENLLRAATCNGKRLPQLDEGEPGAFTEPVLEVYTDMQDILLLDPIHEVDETGWPKQS